MAEKTDPLYTIALVAHDNRKKDLLEWVDYNRETLSKHNLISTGTTGKMISEGTGLKITALHSGPIGGDQEIGAKIVNNEVDFLIFFWDGLDAHPHDPDVKALLRLSVIWNLPTACNRSTANMLISSPLFKEGFERKTPDIYRYARDKSK